MEERLLEEGHLVLECSLNKTVSTHALIDCGATGLAFIDEDFAHQNCLELIPLREPRSLEVIDGRPISSGAITHAARFSCSIGDHGDELVAFVTKMDHYSLVLGIPWMRKHDVNIRFASDTVIFDSPSCLGHGQDPVVVKGVNVESLEVESVPVSRTSPVSPLSPQLDTVTAHLEKGLK
jgi:hypothetical protein